MRSIITPILTMLLMSQAAFADLSQNETSPEPANTPDKIVGVQTGSLDGFIKMFCQDELQNNLDKRSAVGRLGPSDAVTDRYLQRCHKSMFDFYNSKPEASAALEGRYQPLKFSTSSLLTDTSHHKVANPPPNGLPPTSESQADQ